MVLVLLPFFSGVLVAAEQCERLFIDEAQRATCETLLGLRSQPVSDDELRELVSRQVHGVSAAEAALANLKRQEREQKAKSQAMNIQDTSQCGRLFPRGFERDVCIWGGIFTSRLRSDEEQKAFVAEHIKQTTSDEQRRSEISSAVRQIEEGEIQRLIVELDAEERRNAEAARDAAQPQATAEELAAAQKEYERQAVIARMQNEAAEKARIAAEERREAAERAAARRLDAELRKEKIGFLPTGWELGGFGSVLIVRFLLQNNTQTTAKDFLIECDTAGGSGTRLNRVRKVLYQSLDPKRRRSFELNMGFVNSQTERVGCVVVSWR